MTPRLATALALVCATAAAPARARAEERPDLPAATETEALRGSVLVWHDAALYTDAADDAQVVRVAPAAARKERVGFAVPMRVVSTKGAFVEVEPVEDGGCTWSRLEAPDDVARMRLFVRRADIAPVLAKPFAKTFPDGTKVALRPGLPVVPTAAGYAFSLRGVELAAEIPAASVAFAYPTEHAKGKVALAAHEFALDVGAKAALGDRAFAVTAELAGLHAAAMEKKGDTALVSLEDRCAAVTVAAPAKAVKEVDEESASLALGDSGGGSGVLDLRNADYLPVGTPLSAGARQVAIAGKPIYLQDVGHGKTVCVTRRLRLDTAILPPDTTDLDDKLKLCAPISKVAHEKYRSSSSANGTTKR